MTHAFNFGAKLAASSCSPCDMPNSPTNKKHMTGASPAVTDASEHSEEIGKPEVVETEHSEVEAKQPEEGIKSATLGLWDRIRAKKERGGKAAKPGDKDYPDSKSWKKVTAISKKSAAQSSTKLAAVGLNDNAVMRGERNLAPVELPATGPDMTARRDALRKEIATTPVWNVPRNMADTIIEAPGNLLSAANNARLSFGKQLGDLWAAGGNDGGRGYQGPPGATPSASVKVGPSPNDAAPVVASKAPPAAPKAEAGAGGGGLMQYLKDPRVLGAAGLGTLGLGGLMYYANRPKKKNKEEEEVKSASGFGKFLGKMMGAAAPAANVAGDAAKGVKRFGTGAQLPAPALPGKPPVSPLAAADARIANSRASLAANSPTSKVVTTDPATGAPLTLSGGNKSVSYVTANRDAQATALAKAKSARPGAVPPPTPAPRDYGSVPATGYPSVPNKLLEGKWGRVPATGYPSVPNKLAVPKTPAQRAADDFNYGVTPLAPMPKKPVAPPARPVKTPAQRAADDFNYGVTPVAPMPKKPAAPFSPDDLTLDDFDKSASGFGKMLGSLMKTPAQAGRKAMMAGRNNLDPLLPKGVQGVMRDGNFAGFASDPSKLVKNPAYRAGNVMSTESAYVPRGEALNNIGFGAAQKQTLKQLGVAGAAGAGGVAALSGSATPPPPARKPQIISATQMSDQARAAQGDPLVKNPATQPAVTPMDMLRRATGGYTKLPK